MIAETQIVVETTIDSAEDGNGQPVMQQGNTTSDIIRFTYSGHITPEDTEVIRTGFECSLDGNGGFVDCTTDHNSFNGSFSGSKQYNATNLSLGPHYLLVRAYVVVEGDGGENKMVDPIGDRFDWNILPETRIDLAIDGNFENVTNGGNTTSSNIIFSFSGLKNDVPTFQVDGFECRLSTQANFQPCEGPTLGFTGSQEYFDLPPGIYTFEVRAYDEINEGSSRFYDPEPATWIWEVLQEEQIVVGTTLENAVDGNTNPVNDGDATDSNDINFTFSGNVTPAETEVQSQGFECSLDFNGFVPCNGDLNDFTSSQRYDNLSIGFHFFRVSAFVFVNDQKIVDLTIHQISLSTLYLILL